MTLAILCGLSALATFGCLFTGQKWPGVFFMTATLVLAVVA
jgi:hypothetical protein